MDVQRFIWSLVTLCALTPPLSAQLPSFEEPVLLEDLAPGEEGSAIDFLLPVDDRGVFVVRREGSPIEPKELWATDGTPAGTFRIDPGDLSLLLPQVDFIHTDDLLYFTGIDEPSGERGIWRTDGTAAGTFELARDLVLGIGGTRGRGAAPVVFTAGPPEDDFFDIDFALWTTDGTPAGTREIHDLTTARPDLEEVGGSVYFLDSAPAKAATALWKTDGTSEGTELVAVPDEGSFQSIADSPPCDPEGVYLVQERGPSGPLALWHSDVSTKETRKLLEVGRFPLAGSGLLQCIGDFADGRTLWEVRSEEIEHSLWMSDGTVNGTFRLLRLDEIFPAGSVQPIISTAELTDSLYFDVSSPEGGRQLWRTDGSRDGTERWLASRPDLEQSSSPSQRALAGRLVLQIDRPGLGMEPWVSDGTPEGTRLMADLCPGPCSSSPFAWIETDGPLLFPADTDEQPHHQFWASDLTPAGTSRVTDFAGGVLAQATSFGRSRGHQLLLPGHFLFTADDGATGYELWSLPLPAFDPLPPPGPWHRSEAVPGFETKVRITPPNGTSIAGSPEPECIPETACFSGALEGRSEVFVRVVGPKPNGMLWPTLVKFSTSQIEVWIRQLATDVTRYYRLEGARPGFDELPGLFDRNGFEPQP